MEQYEGASMDRHQVPLGSVNKATIERHQVPMGSVNKATIERAGPAHGGLRERTATPVANGQKPTIARLPQLLEALYEQQARLTGRLEQLCAIVYGRESAVPSPEPFDEGDLSGLLGDLLRQAAYIDRSMRFAHEYVYLLEDQLMRSS